MEELLKNNMFATHAIAAAGSVTLGTTLTHPLDTLKTIVQVGAGSGKQLVAAQALDRVRLISGYSGLFSGLGWSILGRISGLGARFGIFELLGAFYKDGREDNYVYVSEALLAGIAAGALEAFVTTPFEILKLRRQVSSASHLPVSTFITEKQAPSPVIARLLRGYTPDKKVWDHTVGLLSTLSTRHSNIIGSLKDYPWMISGSGRPPSVCDVKRPLDIISLEGWSALWRGIRSGLLRDCVFGGIFFSTWQFIHIGMLNWKAIEMNPEPRTMDEIGPVSPLGATIAAGFSGSVAAAASHCFDTSKSRSQCVVLPKYVSMERRLMRWNKPGNWFERKTGINPADRNILFRGIWLRMARSGFSSFIIVGSYFLAVDLLTPT